jgi:hypothetical protein
MGMDSAKAHEKAEKAKPKDIGMSACVYVCARAGASEGGKRQGRWRWTA